MIKLLAFAVLIFSSSSVLWGANYSNPVEGIYKGAFGDTISVEVPSTVSKSRDNVLTGDLSFQVNSSTGYRNFNQLPDLQPGDEVKVEYSEDLNSKSKRPVAIIITKIKEPTPAEVYVVQ